MNLRIKFTLYISALVFLTIAGIAFNIHFAQKKFLAAQFSSERERTFKTFVKVAEEALSVKDDIQVYNAIHSLISVNSPAVVYAAFVSPSSGIMSDSRDRDRNMETAFAARFVKVNSEHVENYLSMSGENITEFAVPVNISGEYEGTIIAGFSLDYMNSMIASGVGIISKKILIVSLAAFLFAVFVANFMAYHLSKPMRMLDEASQKIAGGDFNVHVDIARSDELGRLGKSFNDMARRVREIDTMKDSFVSSVSHELRSPLAAIDGYCDLLIEAVNGEYSKEQMLKGLKIIKDASLRLTSFVNNILDLAKIKAGKFELKLGPVNMENIIKDTVTLFESLAVTQNKKLVCEISGQLPAVLGDAEKNKQIITNLLSNAMKFTKEGDTIKVTAGISPEDSYGSKYAEFAVSDTGIGIPKADLEKVFEKFYQVKEGEFKKPKGTGLGLSLVYEFIKMQGGRIWAEGDTGIGTTFKFVLPVQGR
jgi:signal transduction histidine kinase